MKNIKLLITSLVALGLLSACGENFKANLTGGSEEPIVLPNEVEEPAKQFAADFLGSSASSNEELERDIKQGGFEINVDVTSARGASDRLNSISASFFGFDCNKYVVIRNTSIEMSKLSSQELMAVGTEGNYQVVTQCMDATCSQMSASLQRKENNGQLVGSVLYWMVAQTPVAKAGGTGYTQKFISKPINLPQYSSTSTFMEKWLRCNQTTDMNSGQTTTSATGTGSLVNPIGGTTTTSGNQNAFGTTSGTNNMGFTPGLPF